MDVIGLQMLSNDGLHLYKALLCGLLLRHSVCGRLLAAKARLYRLKKERIQTLSFCICVSAIQVCLFGWVFF